MFSTFVDKNASPTEPKPPMSVRVSYVNSVFEKMLRENHEETTKCKWNLEQWLDYLLQFFFVLEARSRTCAGEDHYIVLWLYPLQMKEERQKQFDWYVSNMIIIIVIIIIRVLLAKPSCLMSYLLVEKGRTPGLK
jgi:hypothetical protein